MDNRCIGIFDSGLGGLTAVKEIMELLPGENLIYFGDTGRVPYGTRSVETIIKYSLSDIRFLESFDVKLIVVACGTVSSVALPLIGSHCRTPIVGVVEVTCEAAMSATRNNRIGIIGTAGTVNSGAYGKYILEKNPAVKTFSKACPLFVPLVENGHFDTPVARLVVEEYLTEIKNEGVDTLILGCTHYPLLNKVISDFMGEDVALINSGAQIARCLSKQFGHLMDSASEKLGECRYFVSDNIESFTNLASLFLQRDVNGQVIKIDIERY